MKTGKEYNRYGQTGLRPEDFTGPCAPCSTFCDDEIAGLLSKFNFFTLDTGDNGELLSIPSDSFRDFSTAGDYELEDVHVRISKRETFLGDIRIDFEDKGDKYDASPFAKYSLPLVYQHFNGAFSEGEEAGEDGTTPQCKCYLRWERSHHKRVDSERLIQLSGCGDCISDTGETELRLIDTDYINGGVIEENMVNTSTTIETIDVFAVIDHFNVFPVCGGLAVDESGTFEFDYTKEKEDDDDVEERFKGEGFYIFARSNCSASRYKFNVASHSQHPHFVGSSANSRFAQNFRNSKGRFFDNDSYSRSLGIKRESRLTQIGKIYHVKIHNASWGDFIVNQIPASDAGGPEYWTTEHPFLHCPPSVLKDDIFGGQAFDSDGIPQGDDAGEGSGDSGQAEECKWCQSRGGDEESPGEEGSAEVPTSTRLLTLPFLSDAGEFSFTCSGENKIRKYSGDFCEEQKKYIFPDEESALESLLERLREKETIIGCTTQRNSSGGAGGSGISEGDLVLDDDGNPTTRGPESSDSGGGSGFAGWDSTCPNNIPHIECGDGYLTPFARLHELDENNEPIFENPQESEPEDSESESSGSIAEEESDEEEQVAKFGSWSQAYIHDFKPEDDPVADNCSEQDRQLDSVGLVGRCMPRIDGYIKLNSEEITSEEDDTEQGSSEEGSEGGSEGEEGETTYHDVFLEYMLKDREEQQDRYRIIEPNKDDRFNLSNITYLVNQSKEEDDGGGFGMDITAGETVVDSDGNPTTRGPESSDSGGGGGGDENSPNRCSIRSACSWKDTDFYAQTQTQFSENNTSSITGGSDQIIGITYYEINLAGFQNSTPGSGSTLDINEDMGILILPEQIYQKTFDVILEQISPNYNLGGFESTDIADITMDWIERGTSGKIALSVIEYIYRANKAIYFYSNDPILVVAEGENVKGGVAQISAHSCGPPTQIIGMGEEVVNTGCLDTFDAGGGWGEAASWSPAYRDKTAGNMQVEWSPPYTLAYPEISENLVTCNERELTFFVDGMPPEFDAGQRVHDCHVIVDDVYLFPGASEIPKNIKRGTQDLEFENELVKKCLYDEDGNIKDTVPEGMICTEEPIEEGEEEIETLCGKKGFVYIVHRKTRKPISFAPNNPTDGGNSERVGINCKTCFEEFPEPEDKYFYQCSTQIGYLFTAPEVDDARAAFESFEPDLAIEISGSNYCSIQYPLDLSFTIDPFTGNRHGCQTCPDYVAECVYWDGGDLRSCKMMCGSPQEDIIEFPYCDKMGDHAIYVGAELPCCDNCYSSQDEGDEDGEDPGDPGDPGGMDDPAGMGMWGGGGDLDTCKKQSYACGVGVSPHQSGYWWWRTGRSLGGGGPLSGDDISSSFNLLESNEFGVGGGGGEGCGDCFSAPRQFLEHRCCHRGVECDYYAIDITEGTSQIIVPGVVKTFEELPLEIKLY